MNNSNNNEWFLAIQDEINSMHVNNTWDLMELPKGRKLVGVKWVYKLKTTVDGSKRYKARLVAKGFSQKYGQDYDEIFAPVVKITTLRTLLAVASHKNMFVRHIDVKTAFLNGIIDTEIYIKQPEGFVEPGKENLVCKLNRSIYGLKQSARCWNQRINDIFIKFGFRRGIADNCLYIKENKGDFIYVLIYVDDIIISSTN